MKDGEGMANRARYENSFDGNAARKLSVSGTAVRRPTPQPQREKQKRDNLIRITEKELRRARRKNINPLKVGVLLVCITMGFSLVAYSVYGQVQLTELTEKINAAQKSLTQLESTEVQLQMQATSNMNVSELEEYAKNELGMEKINRSQMTYINLASEDQGAVLVEDKSNFWEKICSFFGF